MTDESCEVGFSPYQFIYLVINLIISKYSMKLKLFLIVGVLFIPHAHAQCTDVDNGCPITEAIELSIANQLINYLII